MVVLKMKSSEIKTMAKLTRFPLRYISQIVIAVKSIINFWEDMFVFVLKRDCIKSNALTLAFVSLFYVKT